MAARSNTYSREACAAIAARLQDFDTFAGACDALGLPGSTVRNAFRRHGLGPVKSYVGARPKPEPEPEQDTLVPPPMSQPFAPVSSALPPPPPVPTEHQLQRVLFVPDVHRPYHDKDAWACMVAAARSFQPEIVVVLGDFADFYSVSFHSKDPRRRLSLDDEVCDVLDGLDELDALGASRKVFVMGNHEHRLQRYLTDKAPAMFGIVDCGELFQLERRGWEHVPYRESIKIGKVYVTHDVGHAGKYALAQTHAAVQSNVVIGHTHRMGMHFSGCAEGSTQVACSFGWLGDRSAIDYMHKVKAARDWQLGFGVGYMEPSGTMHLQPVPIIDGACCLEGRRIERPGRGKWGA